MISRRARIIALWSISVAAALWVVAHARYITDLSAFLPANPTPEQKLLVDQLRDGPASRLILIALEGGDVTSRAAVSAALAQRLRLDSEFSSVANGDPQTAERDRAFLFAHRYLLSDAVTPHRFSVAGLRAAISDTIDNLSSSSGLLLKALVPHDPTGELLHILDSMGRSVGPRTEAGAWVSADGRRTLLFAQTVAPGSDTDAQERALAAVRTAFRAALTATGSTASPRVRVPAGAGLDLAPRGSPEVRLRMSGPGFFSVSARTKIKRAATRLSIVSGMLVVGILWLVYRSVPVLVMGLLPVASGAVAGIAAVQLAFGAIHGITLAFGITLIGESVDYSIYFFVQSLHTGTPGSAPCAWQRGLWPTIRLGMLASVCGFASLLPSGFPGLAQLGLYSVSGLIAAAAVTRFVLPELMRRGLTIRDMTPLGLILVRWRTALRRRPACIATASCAIAASALLVLFEHHETLWSHELSSLSPTSLDDQRYDALLRADLGAADVLDIVAVAAPSREAALRGAERASAALRPLVDADIIGDFDTPTTFLPSLATQQARRNALPEAAQLRDTLRRATAGLDLRDDQLSAFIQDVGAARQGALITVADLQGTSLLAAFDALILHRSGQWNALLPLHAPKSGNAAAPWVDLARVGAALSAAGVSDARTLDMKAQTDALYAGYLHEAMRLSLAGLALIVLLLLVALRSPGRCARVLCPLVLAVLVVGAGLVLSGVRLTLLHLVGMLLIVAVGSNYALFFDDEAHRAADAAPPLTLASLGIANVATVIGFGLLSFSQVPVLEALGMTVAPGALLALLFSALITSRSARSA